MEIKLTRFQREEVQGLLDVCKDEFGVSRDDEGWGTLDGDILTVTDPVEAARDLEDRADFMVAEGNQQDQLPQGLGYARSLRMLAEKIRRLSSLRPLSLLRSPDPG